MNQEELKFVGVWELQEWNITNVGNGKTRPAYGGSTSGHIIYTADGWVSALLMEAGRTPISGDSGAVQDLKHAITEDFHMLLDREQLDLVKQQYLVSSSCIAYCGNFSVADEQVHHRVREALLPQMIDTTLTRDYVFAGDTLSLMASVDELQVQLVWRRFPVRTT